VINSNLGRICHRFRDMAKFSVEKRTFFRPTLQSTPNLKMFPLKQIAKILHAPVSHIWLITRAKSFLLGVWHTH